MGGVFKFLKYRTNKINLIIVVVAIICGALTYWIYLRTHDPYQIKLIDTIPANNKNLIIYHDFDHDGFSEEVYIRQQHEVTKRKYLRFSAYRVLTEPQIIDEFNFQDSLDYKRIFFGDYTKDGVDETFVFTQAGDSLFLTVIDINQKRWLLKRELFLHRQLPNRYHEWDIHGVFAGTIDVAGLQSPKIIIYLRSGISQRPRGIYVYDLENRKIVKEFLMDSPIFEPFFYDMTGDNIPEIILAGSATGNIEGTRYNDFTCWLFVLDHNLQPVFSPINVGEYPSRLFANPVTIRGDKYLLLSYYYLGEKTPESHLLLINNQGKIVQQRLFSDLSYLKCFINGQLNPPVVYANFGGTTLMKLDVNLNTLTKVQIRENKRLGFHTLRDLDVDGQLELIAYSNQGLSILDLELNEIAKTKLNPRFVVQFRRKGPNVPPDMVIFDYSNLHTFAFQKNISYTWVSKLYSLLVGFIVFIGLVILKKSSTVLSTYAGYFYSSLRETSSGILILNIDGKIIHVNSRLKSLLNLSLPLRKNQQFEEALEESPVVVTSILKCMDSGSKQSISLLSGSATDSAKLKVTVSPILSKIGFKVGYVFKVEIDEKLTFSEQLNAWILLAQEITHDIRSPIVSVGAGLDTIKLKIGQVAPESESEICSDIQALANELKRISILTNVFLKVPKLLEAPEFKAVDIYDLINKSIMVFRNMAQDRLKFNVDIDSDVEYVRADSQQLELVIHFLVENAINAMRGQGTIEIKVSLAQDLTNVNRKYAEIQVVDSGTGIPDDIKNRIFERSFTTKEFGSGVGLTFAKQIVENHGGEIGFWTQEKVGTVFWFKVPLCTESS